MEPSLFALCCDWRILALIRFRWKCAPSYISWAAIEAVRVLVCDHPGYRRLEFPTRPLPRSMRINSAGAQSLVCNCFALIVVAAITQPPRSDLSKALISIASADDP